MTFSEKLKQAMQELHLNQRQVCGMTGKSKGSVSQYLSGKQIPSDDVQSAIAVALGLESDYFSKSDEQVVVLPTAELRNGVIPRLDVEKAAKLLQMNHNTVRKGLQQGVCMLIQRMKAFKAKDFTKELTGADPMTLIRNKIAGYYGQVWEKELMNIAQAVLLQNHRLFQILHQRQLKQYLYRLL